MSKRSKRRLQESPPPRVPDTRTAAPSSRNGPLTAAICLGLLCLVAIPYAQVSQHKFILCDDNEYIYENPQVRQGLTMKGVEWAFVAPHASNWHPLTWMSHMLDYQWFGEDAGWHHLISVALHAASAVLLFLALRMMTGSVWGSAAVAALFAVHPLRVESVAWAAERKDVLSGLFWMLTLLGYAWYVRRPGVLRYMLVFLSLALGLMSKSMLVTLPCVLLLLDVWPLGRWSRESARWLLLEKVPLAALAAADCVMAVYGQKVGSSVNSLEALPMGSRIANAAVSYVAYLWQTVWPVDLSIFYPHPGIMHRGLSPSFVALAAGATLLLTGVTVVVLWSLRSRPYLAVGWFWYLGALVPVIGILQVGIQARADRYTYLPMIGIYLMVVWAVRELTLAKPVVRPFVIAGAVTAIVVCATLTVKQVARWKNSYTLFGHAVEVDPKNYFCYNRLGMAYRQDKKIDKAVELVEQAVCIHPGDPSSNHNLGVCYFDRQEYNKAQERFETVLKMKPDSVETLNTLGSTYAQQGRLKEALALHKQSHDKIPGDARFVFNMGMDLEQLGQIEQAAEAYDLTQHLDPTFADTNCQSHFAEVYFQLGLLRQKQRRFLEAVTAFQKAVRFLPGEVSVHMNLGVAYAELGDVVQAERQFNESLRIDPNCAVAKRNLALLHARAKSKEN